jgi:hypothetical protein
MRNAGPAALTLLPGEAHPAWPELRDLAFTLATEAAALTGRLAPGTASAVGDLVRGMNCYYSNLIEGHDTRPIDIERALRADLAAEPKRRDLQLEAAAHIAVQAAIDTDVLDTTTRPSALATTIHAQFYIRLPDSLRWVEAPETRRRVEVLPGRLRVDDVRALRKGQARAFNITRDIRGEARLVERAFGLGAGPLAEAVRFVTDRLELKAA